MKAHLISISNAALKFTWIALRICVNIYYIIELWQISGTTSWCVYQRSYGVARSRTRRCQSFLSPFPPHSSAHYHPKRKRSRVSVWVLASINKYARVARPFSLGRSQQKFIDVNVSSLQLHVLHSRSRTLFGHQRSTHDRHGPLVSWKNSRGTDLRRRTRIYEIQRLVYDPSRSKVHEHWCNDESMEAWQAFHEHIQLIAGDLKQATNIAAGMVKTWGMTTRFKCRSFDTDAVTLDASFARLINVEVSVAKNVLIQPVNVQ